MYKKFFEAGFCTEFLVVPEIDDSETFLNAKVIEKVGTKNVAWNCTCQFKKFYTLQSLFSSMKTFILK